MTSRLDLTPDELLSTTRTVRKRLDLARPVPRELVEECLELAFQAPSGGHLQGWHFVVVTDAERRRAVGELYRRGFYGVPHQEEAGGDPLPAEQRRRIADSATYLADHMHEVPVLVIPCIEGRTEGLSTQEQSVVWGSILPAAWSFMLAARARGLGTAFTSLHLNYEREAAGVLGIPYERVTQAAMIPVAYTLGTEFRPGPRLGSGERIHWQRW